jgi:inner membrane transporter RhtA
VPGVYVLTDVRFASEPLGLLFAFANAALFALYIVLAHRVSRSVALDRLDGLAAAMLIAAIAITPIGGYDAARAFLDPGAIGAGLGVGIASSVIPYVCDQLAMARLKRATYSLMVALLPATATVIGIVVLAQIPTLTELLGVGLIVAAVAIHRDHAPDATGHCRRAGGRGSRGDRVLGHLTDRPGRRHQQPATAHDRDRLDISRESAWSGR